MQENWEAPTRGTMSLDRVQFKLKKVKRYVKGWGYNLARNMKRRKAEIHEELSKMEAIEEESFLTKE